jgi:hypothetical protein
MDKHSSLLVFIPSKFLQKMFDDFDNRKDLGKGVKQNIKVQQRNLNLKKVNVSGAAILGMVDQIDKVMDHRMIFLRLNDH